MPSKTPVLPKKISLFSKEWSLNGKDEIFSDDGDSCFGLCKYDSLEITYKTGTNKDMLQDTLLHEVLHAISSETCIDLTERQVSVLACSLTHFTKTNPKLSEFIFS